MRPQKPYFSIKIEFTFPNLEMFYKTAAIFDSWKAQESRDGWINSGWQLRSPTNGYLFINSYIEVGPEQRADLVYIITRNDISVTSQSHRFVNPAI